MQPFRFPLSLLSAWSAMALLASGAIAQSINGASFALRSSGSTSGNGWTLDENGYLGTYITLAAPSTVGFTLSASGQSGTGAAPRMNLVVNDFKAGWDVGSLASSYSTSVHLPAGTHFVRTEFTNGTAAANRSLTVGNLQISGAMISNTNSNANALAAANTYIEHYRKGAATVSLVGPGNIPLLPGTQVNVELARHAFNFGGAISGHTLANVNTYLADNPAPGTTAYNTQQFINSHFNMIAPTNAGKWANNETVRDAPNYAGSDKVLSYAAAHNMRARMHNLIWGDNSFNGQQPNWVLNNTNSGLLDRALAGDVAAKNELRAEISERIAGYVNSTRANLYTEIDVYNESVHTPSYTNAYGPAGIAGIYNEVLAAVRAAGSSARIMPNEYNVYQWGDQYGNWYRRHIEEMLEAGGTITGIGTQYYVETNPNANNNSPRSASRVMSVLQGLSVLGVPISVTEYGHQRGGAGSLAHSSDPNLHADILEESLRMFFGSPQTQTFVVWGWWSGAADNLNGNVSLVNNAWQLTAVGQRWESLMSQWDTNLNAVVHPDGTIRFTGFHGDYNIGGQNLFANLSLIKGTQQYALTLDAPPDWHFWNVNNSGSWNAGANWTNGAPGGVGHTAHFANAVSPRGIHVSAPVTLGMINFDSAGTYTIAGGTITLDGPAGVAAINVVNGSHLISANIELKDDLNVFVAGISNELQLSGAVNPADQSITKSGDGTLRLNLFQAGALHINSGRVILNPGTGADANAAQSPAHVASLTIAAGAVLDLSGNGLLIDTAGNAPSLLVDIRGHLRNGRLIGSGAASMMRHGYIEVDDAVLIALTLQGDADLDGDVDGIDVGRWAQHFTGELGGSGTAVWSQGDWDYDGDVDGIDVGLWAAAFTGELGGAGLAGIVLDETEINLRARTILQNLGITVVPEPTLLGIVLSVFGAGARRRGVVSRRRQVISPRASIGII